MDGRKQSGNKSAVWRIILDMRFALILVLLCLFFASCSAQKTEGPKPAAKGAAGKPVVLVELFTSEGCSSCPPADEALTYLSKLEMADVEIVTLAFHVDYWDGPAWRDRFSSHSYTERQEEYAKRLKIDSTYTPQMVVDGQREFVGSDLRKATAAFAEEVKVQKGSVTAVLAKEKVKISVSGLPDHEKATVYLAIAEDGLFSKVSGGENAGNQLEHTSVARQLTAIGTIEGGAGKADFSTDIKLDQEWKPENLNYIVIVQEDKSRKVIAVGKAAK
jgi:hypothetical protein